MSNTILIRSYGLLTAISILVGSVIGSSIFVKPAVMASQVADPLLLIGIWVVAGLISLIGAMVNAEIGSMIPDSGGQLVYFKKMYGDTFSFIYGWASFAVVNTASVAAIAYVFAHYTTYFIEPFRFSEQVEKSISLSLPGVGTFYFLEYIGEKLIASGIVVFMTIINFISVKAAGWIQNTFSVLKVVLITGLVVLIFSSGKGNMGNLYHSQAGFSWSIAGIIAAMSGAFAAYDGWNNISFIAGEIKNPGRNIPRALLIGIGICILLYVLTNIAYLYMIPIEKMAHSNLIATDSVTPIMGAAGAGIIAVLVLISTFGATNGNLLACSRVTYAMGKNGDFIAWAGKVHPRFQTPGNALLLHMVWIILFIFSGSFDMLVDLFVFVQWIFYGFAAYGLFILRKKMPDESRPYKIWGYPILPLIFILFTLFYSVLTIYNDIHDYYSGNTSIIKTSISLIILLAGFLIIYFKKRALR